MQEKIKTEQKKNYANELAKVKCRNAQIRMIKSLLGEDGDEMPPCLYVYGHKSTGKSVTVSSILKESEKPFVWINCATCYTQRHLYEKILVELSRDQSRAEDSALPLRCNVINDFDRRLKLLVDEKNYDSIVLVFDEAERLVGLSSHILPCLLKLQQLVGRNVCTIFISQTLFVDRALLSYGYSSLLVHFPSYGKEELIEIMMIDRPSGHTKSFYQQYLQLILSVFHFACRDVTEINHMAQLNFPAYVKPIQEGEATENCHRVLWKNIQPNLARSLKAIYVRELSNSQFEDALLQDEEAREVSVVRQAAMELPYHSKFLLIAAYLASYNPAKTDKKFFSKRHDTISKRAKLIKLKKSDRTSNQLIGPKQFPVDRLLAIFHSVVEQAKFPVSCLFRQIGSLVTSGMLVRTSFDAMDAPKFKCTVNLEFIKAIAKTVDFEITKYLYDCI